jgi:hypothetical protein
MKGHFAQTHLKNHVCALALAHVLVLELISGFYALWVVSDY